MGRLLQFAAAAFAGVALATAASAADGRERAVVVGSKRFTESYILAEIVTRTFEARGIPAEHRAGLGNTGILEQALTSGAVDVYPEYTGTIVREILKGEGNPSLDELNARLAPRALVAALPLGFDDSYAIAMSEKKAESLGIRTISDLFGPRGKGLALGFSHEFLERADGWPALRRAYAGGDLAPSGIDHGIAYEQVAAGRLDVTDVYSTDAKLARYGLRVLDDDKAYFPKYDAVLLARKGVDLEPLRALEHAIDRKAMIEMNAAVELDGATFADVARRFLAGEYGRRSAATAPASSDAPAAASARAASREAKAPSLVQRVFAADFARLAWQHGVLVFGSLAIAVAIGVPIGIAAWRWPRLAAWLLGAVAVLQTVPSLALLAFLIAIVGRIGVVPAVIALFLYALLPIVRNTHAGLAGVPRGMAEAALSLGLTARQSLSLVQLPLALPTLLAGVKTAAVINVGTATMAAFIGAGGFGERIVAGLAVNDTDVMLAGALPAAALALVVQVVFDGLERWIAPRRDRER